MIYEPKTLTTYDGVWSEVKPQTDSIPPESRVHLVVLPSESSGDIVFLEEALKLKEALQREHFYFTATQQQFDAALDEIAQRNRLLPALPDTAFDRESLYEDRL